MSEQLPRNLTVQALALSPAEQRSFPRWYTDLLLRKRTDTVAIGDVLSFVDNFGLSTSDKQRITGLFSERLVTVDPPQFYVFLRLTGHLLQGKRIHRELAFVAAPVPRPRPILSSRGKPKPQQPQDMDSFMSLMSGGGVKKKKRVTFDTRPPQVTEAAHRSMSELLRQHQLHNQLPQISPAPPPPQPKEPEPDLEPEPELPINTQFAKLNIESVLHNGTSSVPAPPAPRKQSQAGDSFIHQLTQAHGSGAGLQQQGTGMQFSNGLQQQGTGLQQQGTGLQQQGTGLQQQGTGLQQQGTGLQQQGTGLQQQGTGFAGPGLIHQGTGMQSRVASIQYPGTGLQQQGTGLQQQVTGGLQQQGTGFNPQMPLQQQGTGFSGPGMVQGLQQQGTGFQQQPRQGPPVPPRIQPQSTGQFVGLRTQGTGQSQALQPQGSGQFQGLQPQGSGQFQGLGPQTTSQFQGLQQQGSGQFQGLQPQGSGQFQDLQPQGAGQFAVPGLQAQGSGQFQFQNGMQPSALNGAYGTTQPAMNGQMGQIQPQQQVFSQQQFASPAGPNLSAQSTGSLSVQPQGPPPPPPNRLAPPSFQSFADGLSPQGTGISPTHTGGYSPSPGVTPPPSQPPLPQMAQVPSMPQAPQQFVGTMNPQQTQFQITPPPQYVRRNQGQAYNMQALRDQMPNW